MQLHLRPAFLLLPLVSSYGLNCNGAPECQTIGTNTVATKLTGYITNYIDPNKLYSNGDRIACVREQAVARPTAAICAYLQYITTGSVTGAKIKEIAHYINENNCLKCGSVPYYYPKSNNVYDGELTYNYVVEGCGKSGLCDGTVATTTQTTVSVTTSIALTTTTKNGGVESKRELPASSSNLML